VSASNNLSSQFRTLYRGLYDVHPSEIDTTQVGAHWTVDPSIAYNFATGRDVEGYVPDSEEFPMQGTVIEAKVHRRHIIDPESAEGESWHDLMGVFDHDSIEQERTVRPGAIIHPQKMAFINEDENTESLVTPERRRGWRA
jgi:hypothetical protein